MLSSDPGGVEEPTQYICMYHLKGRCAFGGRCFNVHSSLPYQWFYKAENDREWMSLQDEENTGLELQFSDPANSDYYIPIRLFNLCIKGSVFLYSDIARDLERHCIWTTYLACLLPNIIKYHTSCGDIEC